MGITGEIQSKYSVLDLGFSRLLTRPVSLRDSQLTTPEMTNNFVNGLNTKMLGAGELGGLIGFGHQSVVVPVGDNIQLAIDKVNKMGGGTVLLENGTHKPNYNITIYSSIFLQGQNGSVCIIDFDSQSYGIAAAGTGVYTTGSITTITSSVFVTGSGTSWLANVSAGQHLFLGTRWYEIAAVTSDTTLVLSEGYGDNVTLPASYRIATAIKDVRVANITIKNSTTTGIALTDCRKIVFDNILSLDNNKGGVFTNCSEFNNDRFVAVSSTDNGIELTNVGLSDWESVNSISSGGKNFVFNNVKTMTLFPIAANDAAGDGIEITTGVNIKMTVEASGNGAIGLECVSDCSDLVIDGIFSGNASDNIKLAATTDNCIIYAGDISGAGGYGVNIAASTCDTNKIIGNNFASNTLGDINDSGTGTVRVGNSPITINTFTVNTSGDQTVAGVKTFTSDPIIPDEAYGSGWNGILEPATKNAIYDKIEDILDGVTFTGDIIVPDEAYGSGWNGSLEVPTKNAVYDKIEALSTTSKNGVFSKDMSTTTTNTIAHGLGRTPSLLRVTMFAGPANGAFYYDSVGSYDGSTQNCVYVGDSNGSGSITRGTIANIVYYVFNGVGSNDNKGTSSLDATNITITWSKTGTPTGTAYFIWEVL